MDEDDFQKARQRLLDEIEADARDTRRWTGRRRFSASVMAAMAKVPRHRFVPADDVQCAYINRPRGIGHGQTISQPYIVALMTDLIDPEGDDRVLEIGAGSGYQAAVLAEVVGRVYTLEVVADLAAGASKRLRDLGYDNVEVREGDGWRGWPEKAPFDKIMVTAAPEEIPGALVEQLKPGGLMIIPIGRVHHTQSLIRGIKRKDGTLETEIVLPVAFVPMVRKKES